jgi:general secretion pathway protein D
MQSSQYAGGSSLPGSGTQGSAAFPGAGLTGGVNATGSNTGTSPGSTSSDSQPSETSAGVGPPGDEDRVHIAVDQANNTLIILASRQDYQRALKIIQRLDIVPNQVLIEAIIAEVSLTDDLSFGVRWFFQGKNAGYSLTDAASAVFGSSFPGFSYALALANIQATLNALNSITKVNVISSPSLTVLDHRTATLQIGDQVPVVTQSAVGVTTSGAPIVNSVNYRDTGVILSITPSIAESGRVLLNIEQEVSSVATTTTSNIDSPTIKQRRIKTTVLVNNGESLALGGLIQDQTNDTRTQVPLFGDIPLVGNAMSQKQNTIGKTELIILIAPHVIRNLDEAREISDEYRSQFDIHRPQTRGGPPSPGRTLQRIVD